MRRHRPPQGEHTRDISASSPSKQSTRGRIDCSGREPGVPGYEQATEKLSPVPSSSGIEDVGLVELRHDYEGAGAGTREQVRQICLGLFKRGNDVYRWHLVPAPRGRPQCLPQLAKCMTSSPRLRSNPNRRSISSTALERQGRPLGSHACRTREQGTIALDW